MIKTFPKERAANRALLLEAVDGIAETLRASGPRSEELGTLAPEAVKALRESGMFRLKLANEMGGAEADPVTEMLVLENLAYHDLSGGWCTMVGATAIASCGMFLPPSGLAKVFNGNTIPTASISFFPAGRGVREGDGYRISGRWRFNSGVRHAEWVLGGTVIEGGEPLVIFAAFPAKDVTLYDNWGGVVGLRGTGSVDFSVENYLVPRDLTFVWDLLQPKPLRGGPGYLLPPFSYVAKEHGSVAIGAGRRALDELIKIATSTRGTFRSSKLDERQWCTARSPRPTSSCARRARSCTNATTRSTTRWPPAICQTAPTSPMCAQSACMPPRSQSASPPWRITLPATPACIIRTSSAGCCATSTRPASIR